MKIRCSMLAMFFDPAWVAAGVAVPPPRRQWRQTELSLPLRRRVRASLASLLGCGPPEPARGARPGGATSPARPCMAATRLLPWRWCRHPPGLGRHRRTSAGWSIASRSPTTLPASNQRCSAGQRSTPRRPSNAGTGMTGSLLGVRVAGGRRRRAVKPEAAATTG